MLKISNKSDQDLPAVFQCITGKFWQMTYSVYRINTDHKIHTCYK
jgi:hypothetical protein